MQVERWFRVLVIEGALLTGCPSEEDDTSVTDEEEDQDTSATEPSETDGNEETAGDAVCENTDMWSTCIADGVSCCWAAGDSCDVCCGHLSP